MHLGLRLIKSSVYFGYFVQRGGLKLLLQVALLSISQAPASNLCCLQFNIEYSARDIVSLLIGDTSPRNTSACPPGRASLYPITSAQARLSSSPASPSTRLTTTSNAYKTHMSLVAVWRLSGTACPVSPLHVGLPIRADRFCQFRPLAVNTSYLGRYVSCMPSPQCNVPQPFQMSYAPCIAQCAQRWMLDHAKEERLVSSSLFTHLQLHFIHLSPSWRSVYPEAMPSTTLYSTACIALYLCSR